MRKILNWVFPTNQFWSDASSELLRDTVKMLVITISIIYYIWYFYIGVRGIEFLSWKFWVLFIITLVGARFSWYLAEKNPTLGLIAWLTSLMAINTIMIVLLEIPELVIFYAFIPLMAVFVINWQSGVLAGGAVVVVVLWLNQLPLAFTIHNLIPVTLVGSLILLILGWSTGRTLREATSSSLHYYNLANKNLEETRQHQSKLFVTLKDLDMAYYRLNQAHAALVHALKRAENAERMKAELVTFVSHEMRTPLNLIAGFSEMILTSPESYGKDALPGSYRGDVHKIYRNSRHLLELCDDIIDLSRANMGKIPLVREKSDMRVLVLETANMVRDFIQSKGLDLRLEIPEKLPELLIDRLRIRQVLLNLLVNAVRFTDAGGIHICIELSDKYLLTKVIDSGKGIADGDLPAIFEGYFSTGKSGTTWHSGSGLGLPISKKLVEIHGGAMGVESEVDRGTTFWFTLPLQDGQAVEGMQPIALTSPPVQRKELNVSCVLVHEDPRVAALLQRYMPGNHIFPASSFEEGCQAAVEYSALAVISNKPVPAGVDLKNLLWIECPLPDRRVLADQLGVLDILYKPVSVHELFTSLGCLDYTPRNILIVDDDYETVELFQRYLMKRLLIEPAMTAYDGVQALNSMRNLIPDLVLLDLNMPRMNGYQVLEQMKQDHRLANVPVIVISGHLQDENNLNLNGSLHITRPSGYQLSEIAQVLQYAINTMATAGKDELVKVTGSE